MLIVRAEAIIRPGQILPVASVEGKAWLVLPSLLKYVNIAGEPAQSRGINFLAWNAEVKAWSLISLGLSLAPSKTIEHKMKIDDWKGEKIMKVEEVNKAIVEFLKSTVNANARDAKVIKVERSQDGWIGEAEVFEESAFIKSLGLPTRVQDRNIYEIKLTDALEVVSYTRKHASLGVENG